MILLTCLAGVAAALFLLPSLTDLLARGRRLVGRTRVAPARRAEGQRFLCLVAAHDEELLIGDCVRSLRAMEDPEGMAVTVVIADNCRDRTAAIARAEGATCLERHDPTLPGKPHAIAWALTQVRWQAYDAVVIIDADTEVEPRFLRALAAMGPWREKAGQGYHEVLNRSESAWTRLGALLSAANHRHAYPVKQRGDLNTPLLGNGMVIGTEVLARFGWRAFSICEDWEMYALLTAEGVRIDGVPSARVASQEARTLEQSASQRRRWTAGKMTVCARYLWPLFRSRRIDLTQKLDAFAELFAPGPALHLGLVVTAVALLGLVTPPGWAWVSGALLLSLVRTAWYAACALREDPEPGATLRALLYLPVYMTWRVGIAAGSLTMLGDRPWVRTARHLTPTGPPSVPRIP